MKNVFKISRVPKMGHFYKNLSKHPELSIFRPNECQEWNFQLIFHHKLKKKIFDFFYPLPQKKFWIFFSSKISLWVLKRIVLTRLKRFLIFKIHQRSFRTRIGNIINKRYKKLNDVPYSGTERSLMNFKYQKTFSACQDDSFKYP